MQRTKRYDFPNNWIQKNVRMRVGKKGEKNGQKKTCQMPEGQIEKIENWKRYLTKVEFNQIHDINKSIQKKFFSRTRKSLNKQKN